MINVVAYTRFSSDNQRVESIDAQVRAIKEFCINNKYNLVKIYKDEAISGTSINDREEFLKMINDSKNKNFKYVIVHKFDRFARNRYDHIIYEKKLEDNGVKLLSVLEKLSDTPESIILKSVLTGMNEYYSLNLAREVRKGQKENALKCLHNGGLAPLGYDVTIDKTYIINEKEAQAVKLIFEMYLEGKGYATISDELNARGFKNKRGGEFKKLSIRDTLLNEKYTGTFIFGKKDKQGKNTDNEIRIENGIPQIIDKKTFNMVLEKMKNKKTSSRSSAEENYLLTGLCFCGECGGVYSGGYRTVNRNGEVSRGYLCRRRKDKVNKCTNTAIRKEILETLVIEALKENIFTPAQMNIISDRVYNYLKDNYLNTQKEVVKIKKEIEKLQLQKDKILNYNLNGVLNDEEYIKKKTLFDEEILNYKENLVKLEFDTEFLNRDKVFKYLEKLAKKIESSDMTILQNIIFTFIEKIILFKDTIQINLRLFPLDEKIAKVGGDDGN